jgi:hypothetical protein
MPRTISSSDCCETTASGVAFVEPGRHFYTVSQAVRSGFIPAFVEFVGVLSVRPKVTDLVFQLYGRALHPELFETHASRSVDRGGYTVAVSITTTGHLLTWQKDGLILSEVCTAAGQPMPRKRRLISHRVAGERSDRMECRGGIAYQTCIQLETVAADAFWGFQQELAAEGGRQGLLHRFEAGGRMALGAVSLVTLETRADRLLVQCFHTFPDDLSIVKTQSLFECP